MGLKKNKFILLALTFLCSSTYAIEASHEKKSCGNIRAYGEYLYWKVVQEQMQYAAVLPGGLTPIIAAFQGSNDSPVIISEKVSIIEPSFNYKPGFRFGLGYDLRHANWDFQIAWTHLHEKKSKHVCDSQEGIFPLGVPLSALFGFINKDPSEFSFSGLAKNHWHFEFNTLDIEIGRLIKFSHSLYAHPHIGLKVAAIKQHQHIKYIGFSIGEEPVGVHDKRKNNFRGMGPSLSIDSMWEFYPHWNLSSGISGALLCGRFAVNEYPHITVDPNSIKFDFKNAKKHRLRPTIDAHIGIDWNTCIGHKFNALIGVAYEVQYWWNQWQAPGSAIGSLLTGGSSPQGDLMMYGLTAKLAVAF